MKKLVSVEVKGLLGIRRHFFEFPAEDEFVILHGPNGAGKTRLLELITDVLSARAPSARTPFESIRLTFDDASWVRAQRVGRTTKWATSTSGAITRESVEDDDRLLQIAARDLMEQGLIRRVSSPQVDRPFRDGESGERLSVAEAVAKYADEVARDKVPVPYEVRDFVRDLAPSLVEVNRLRTFEEESPGFRSGHFSESVRTEAVDFYARDLARRITEARASHAIDAQSLDGTYPQRLLQAPPMTLGVMEVAALQTQVEQLTDTLQRAALLEPVASPDSFDLDTMKEWQLDALKLHYEDSINKLSTMKSLAERILLFLGIIESKLTGKAIKLTSSSGYTFESPTGPIAPHDLSSGEQHEIIMTYRLIFESSPGQLVLIDEPEISLHVRWQRQFLGDLKKIAQLDGLRFIVATHSPQIVGSWSNRMSSLGEVD